MIDRNIATIIVLVALLFAACGDDDDNGAAGSGGESGGVGGSSEAGEGASGEGAADGGVADGGVADGGVADGGVADTSTEADTGTGADAGAEVEAISSRFVDSDTEEPIAGVEVCWHGDTSVPCVTTGEDGTYTLGGLTRGEWGYVSSEIEGYPTLNQWIVAYERSSLPDNLWDDGRYIDFCADIGEACDDSKGMVSLYVIPNTSGVTFSIDPTSGSGPYYTEDGVYAPDATSSVPGSNMSAGALFVNVDPGMVRGTANLDGSTCTLWVMGVDPVPVDIEVIAGEVSQVAFRCTPDN